MSWYQYSEQQDILSLIYIWQNHPIITEIAYKITSIIKYTVHVFLYQERRKNVWSDEKEKNLKMHFKRHSTFPSNQLIWHLKTSDSDVFRLQILTSKIDLRIVRVKYL